MIVFPLDWRTVGQPIELSEIEGTLLDILGEVDCNCLSYSGGLDSSLLLFYLLKLGRQVRTFTWASEAHHPDLRYARTGVRHFEEAFGVCIRQQVFVGHNGMQGDPAVKEYYRGLAYFTDRIITGDGIDEFMAGYYDHQVAPSEEVYYDRLRRLQAEHLAPLHDNSGAVQVSMPYLDKRLLLLLCQIPLADKVDCGHRKKVMVDLAQGKLPQEIIERKKYGFCTPA